MKKVFVLLVVLAVAYWVYQKTTATKQHKIPLAQGWKADTVKVDKADRELHLCKRGKVARTYTIFLGENPTGHKQCEGDERTPEGLYYLDWRMKNGSCCHKSIHISYPNKRDKAAAKKIGCSAGGSVMIHGMLNGWDVAGNMDLNYDWTNGCIGMKNEDIDEVWKYVNNGTPILIRD